MEEQRRILARVPARLTAAHGLRDWLLREARMKRDTEFLLSGLCERLNDAGVPVDRGTFAITTLHSEHTAIVRMWSKEEGSRSQKFRADRRDSEGYKNSPFAFVHQTRQTLLMRLAETADDRFGIVPELKAEGYSVYLCMPIFFANGDENGIALATKRRGGFSRTDLALICFVMPALAAVLEILGGYRTLDQLLRIYVGDEPHRAILSGAVRRGDVRRIRSAILFADMRSYTRLSSTLSPEKAVEVLNAYFDCLVPPIEEEAGEVLKFMGDGLLAIFRERGDDTGAASASALAAARRALARIDAANQDGTFAAPIAAGIALHHGEAAYGNVGSGERLDFTVIGRDVNLASRIAKLNKSLDEPLLMSKRFTEHLWGNPEPLGLHEVEGFEEKVAVYRPSRPFMASNLAG